MAADLHSSRIPASHVGRVRHPLWVVIRDITGDEQDHGVTEDGRPDVQFVVPVVERAGGTVYCAAHQRVGRSRYRVL
jgi:hypothetical protein